MSRIRFRPFASLCLPTAAVGFCLIACVPTGDAPAMGWPVLAVFLGCQPLPADVPELADGVCPPDATPTCRGKLHWCRLEDDTRHGPWLRLYPEGGVDLLVRYRHGRRHGLWAQWYPAGSKKRAGGFFGDRKHGAWDGWHPNGQQAYHHLYDFGKRRGRWTHWDPAGNVTESTNHPP